MRVNVKTWGAVDVAAYLRIPSKIDNKYSHGVLGVITGSESYPGAAVLGVEAAHRTGIGMVRFFGSSIAAQLVLQRRPEVVTVPGAVDAWLIGSGLEQHGLEASRKYIEDAIDTGKPAVLDAGAIDLQGQFPRRSIITPHAGELERLVPRAQLPERETDVDWAMRAANQLNCVVVLKGHTTCVAAPNLPEDNSEVLTVESPTTWLATAGTGDVLAGTIAALVAVASTEKELTVHELAEIAATGVYLHSQAGERASQTGPFPALDVADALSGVIHELLENRK